MWLIVSFTPFLQCGRAWWRILTMSKNLFLSSSTSQNFLWTLMVTDSDALCELLVVVTVSIATEEVKQFMYINCTASVGSLNVVIVAEWMICLSLVHKMQLTTVAHGCHVHFNAFLMRLSSFILYTNRGTRWAAVISVFILISPGKWHQPDRQSVLCWGCVNSDPVLFMSVAVA